MKKHSVKQAFTIMKERRGEDTIILFHNGNNFEAYERDALIIAREFGLETFISEEMLTALFSQDKLEEFSNFLLDKRYALCISEMRDDSGNFITDIATEDDE